MRLLVTGAFGYLGLAVLRGLEGHRVVACGRPPQNPAARAAVPAWCTLVFGEVAVEGPRLLESESFDGIIHLAGGGGPKKCEADPPAAVRDNVTATTALASAAVRARTPRLLFASTIAVYGTYRASPRPYAETDEAIPDDLYGAVKHAAEAVWTAPGLGGGTALRLANIYGAGAGVDLGIAGAVERFARAAAAGGDITVYGTGEQRIDYVHIDDVVRAIRAALEAPSLPAVVNVGGGRPVSIRELAESCARAGQRLGRTPRLTALPDPGGKIWPDRSLAIDRAGEVLSWRPQVALDDGIAQLVAMMRGSGPEVDLR